MEDVGKCVNLEEPTRVPYFPLGLEFDVTHAGKPLRQCRRNSDVMIDVIANAATDYDWAIVHPDDLGEYESMGIEVTDEENRPPAVKTYLPFTEQSVGRMVFPKIGRDGRMPWHLEVIGGLKQRLAGRACIVGRIAAPVYRMRTALRRRAAPHGNDRKPRPA
jgi:uroporphyrinogen-III decarboxylase